MSDAERLGYARRARFVFDKMCEGLDAFDPVYFDLTMIEFGLAPEDIGSTAAEVATAKRQWRIARAKTVLSGMADGNDAYDPAYFDDILVRFGLAPEDIGVTANEVESAKAWWAEKRAR